MGRICLIVMMGLLFGCQRSDSRPERVWGERGVREGTFHRPRAAVIIQDRLFIIDFTARIQTFDLDGHFLGPTWTTPDYRNGRPSGLGVTRDQQLIVCDSHYHCVRLYSLQGEEQFRFGGIPGSAGGELGYVSDAVQADDGSYYVSEFGQNDRISQFTADGRFIRSWGESGDAPGQFNRVRALALGPDGLLYAADACNHRIQVFQRDGTFVRQFGQPGQAPGELSYPYDLAFTSRGELVVAEYGNCRIQRLTRRGESLGIWGGPGREPGRLASPWALAVDRFDRVHVIDTENHRVQRFSW